MKPSIVKQLFIVCIVLKLTLVNQGPKTVSAISPGKYRNFRNSLGNITISLGETQVTNKH